MDTTYITNHIGLIAGTVLFLVAAGFWKTILWFFGIIIVPDDSLGTVTKKFVIFGDNSNLPDGQIITLKGEAGFQADTLSPGLHVGLWPWQYAIELIKFTCYCDLDDDMEPDGCVLDQHKPEDCIYAAKLRAAGKGRNDCAEWRPIDLNRAH